MLCLCYVLQYVGSFLAGEERAGCFIFVVLWMSCCVMNVMLSLTHPRGAMGWSVVCDCGISWSYSLTF